MLGPHAQKALEKAATETLERIRADQRRANSRLRPLLEHIEANLFEQDLDVNQLKRSCGVRDNSVAIQFHSQLGIPPHAYIEECRLRTGCRLLEDSELKVWQIADLLGYSSIQVFSRAFSRWAGQRPTLFRKKSRQRRAAEKRPDSSRVERDFDYALMSTDSLRRALNGELTQEEAGRLIHRLLETYPATTSSLGDGPYFASRPQGMEAAQVSS